MPMKYKVRWTYIIYHAPLDWPSILHEIIKSLSEVVAQNYNYLRSLPLASQRSELCYDWMLNVGSLFAFSQSMSLSDIAEIAQFTSFQYLSN